ncbi:cytochrome c3 family protein [Desulfuromonas carbonis]|uniref:cytochrome c3 family protein n=1 Tax=Desulfuromonas sp. DDH964 TaxID=1823759 RepID=UPI00078D870E|nr:cytochrome c3 family protein [Desulfuromonas sp. DDH964]AMV71451.1 periplasmic triheme cytochrome c [Desulfuromonas sp. DDH964]
MKKLLVATLLVLFAVAPALAVDSVVLPAKNGDVTFNHKAHSETMECKVCHGEGTPAKIELTKDSAHALCKDCHKTKGAGPTKCGDCHKK